MYGDRLSKKFSSTIGVKEGCPFSQTQFGLCLDELEEIVAKFVKEEGIKEVAVENVVIMLLLYVDNVALAFCKYFKRCAKAYEGVGNHLHGYLIKRQ